MVPSIPEGGTKSRVETQVRVTVDLAHASSSSGEPFKYDRVGSWKWLKLPAGRHCNEETHAQGGENWYVSSCSGFVSAVVDLVTTDPMPHDVLYLTSTISCVSPPYNPVLSCASCQTREVSHLIIHVEAY